MEPITFRYPWLNPAKLDVANVYNYLGPARLAYVRHIWFAIEFPSHDLYVSTNPEDYDDQIVFDKAIRQVLSLAAQLPPRERHLTSLELWINSSTLVLTPL